MCADTRMYVSQGNRRGSARLSCKRGATGPPMADIVDSVVETFYDASNEEEEWGNGESRSGHKNAPGIKTLFSSLPVQCNYKKQFGDRVKELLDPANAPPQCPPPILESGKVRICSVVGKCGNSTCLLPLMTNRAF
jgi:hypothetical protein